MLFEYIFVLLILAVPTGICLYSFGLTDTTIGAVLLYVLHSLIISINKEEWL